MKLSIPTEPRLCETACYHGFPFTHSSKFLPGARPVKTPASFGKIFRSVVHLSARNPLFSRKIGYRVNVAKAKFLNSFRNQPGILKFASSSGGPLGRVFPLSVLGIFAFVFPSLAAEAEMEVSDKINIEAVVVGIDNFFNRYPYFVSGVTFIWLVVIPLTREYLKKYKQISALDAFKKLKEVPNAQLLDVRKQQSLNYLPSPSLKVLKKSVTQVEFTEGSEEEFLTEVLKVYRDPGNTVICVLDNFGADSLKVAELLVSTGFNEAYAIKDGLRGKEGWQSIQETLFPASVHVYPRKKKSKIVQAGDGEEKPSSSNSNNGKPGHTLQKGKKLEPDQISKNSPTNFSETRPSDRPLSPFPNYEDLKPPSSSSPAKPQQ